MLMRYHLVKSMIYCAKSKCKLLYSNHSIFLEGGISQMDSVFLVRSNTI